MVAGFGGSAGGGTGRQRWRWDRAAALEVGQGGSAGGGTGRQRWRWDRAAADVGAAGNDGERWQRLESWLGFPRSLLCDGTPHPPPPPAFHHDPSRPLSHTQTPSWPPCPPN
eukprot:359174-Chlamydomonas_euryale.AAC.2